MEERYIKAQTCLNKEFHFMQMQADAAKARGGILMEKEDIQYLRAFHISNKPKSATLNMIDIEYDSKTVLKFIEESKKEGCTSVVLIDKDLTNDDDKIVRDKGYFIVLDYPGVKVTYIFFTEEELINHRVLNFQEMFGTFVGFHRTGVI